MSKVKEEIIKNWSHFVYVVDVAMGTFNGDPDNDGIQRMDIETGHGYATDSCLKRIIRDYILRVYAAQPGYDIFIKRQAVLNEVIAHVAKELGFDENVKLKNGEAKQVLDELCRRFVDLRAFGGVLSVGILSKAGNAGLTGVVQPGVGWTVNPIMPLDDCIAPNAVHTLKESEAQEGVNRSMGNRSGVRYAPFVFKGSVDPSRAAVTGMTEKDLAMVWEAMVKGPEFLRSQFRGQVSAQKLVLFKHDSPLGNCRAHDLYKRVSIKKSSPEKPAWSWEDYDFSVDLEGLPEGITFEELL